MDSIKCNSVTKYQKYTMNNMVLYSPTDETLVKCTSVTKYQKYTVNNIVLFIGTDESLVALCDKAMAINKEMMK